MMNMMMMMINGMNGMNGANRMNEGEETNANDPFKQMHNCFSSRNNYVSVSFSSAAAASVPCNIDTLSQLSGERSSVSLDIEEIENLKFVEFIFLLE